MNTEEVIQRTSTYKSMYNGNEFQCMNGAPDKLGRIFKIIDIEPDRNGRLFALLNDSSRISVDQLNRDFSMITEQTPALRLDQVKSVSDYPKIVEVGNVPEIIADLNKAKKNLPDDIDKSVVDPLAGLRREGQGQQSNTLIKNEVITTKKVNPTDIFGMFSSSKVNLNLSIEITMPPISLLQIMYSQSVDKDDFLEKFSQYIYSNITMDAIKTAVSIKLDKKKKIKDSDN